MVKKVVFLCFFCLFLFPSKSLGMLRSPSSGLITMDLVTMCLENACNDILTEFGISSGDSEIYEELINIFGKLGRRLRFEGRQEIGIDLSFIFKELSYDLRLFVLSKIVDILIIFDKMSCIRSLKLGDNGLSSLTENFSRLRNIKFIDLENNKFKEFPEQLIFSKKLKHLSFCNNKLKDIPGWINEFVELRTLDLSFNKFKILSPFILLLPSLKYLDLSNNKIEELPFSMNVQSGDVIYWNWGYLNLSGNLLTKLNINFKYFPNLEELDLRRNPLENIGNLNGCGRMFNIYYDR